MCNLGNCLFAVGQVIYILFRFYVIFKNGDLQAVHIKGDQSINPHGD